MSDKGGRPPIEIDWVEFDKLCLLQCTLREIASWFTCSEDTIERKVQETHGIGFAEYYKQKKGHGKIAIRRKQFQTAMEGNVSMLIWLGKNWLDQSDKQEVEINQTVTVQTKLEALRNTVIDMIIDQPRKGLLGSSEGDRETPTATADDGMELDNQNELPKEPVPSS